MAAYINARKLRTPAKARSRTVKVIADWETMRVRLALGQQFRRTSRVVLKRPWWMPEALFMWLLRAIVIETAKVEERVS